MVIVLITGISGFVGSRLAKKLVTEGDKYYGEPVEVFGLVRYRADNPSYRRLHELRISDKVKLIYGNLEDYYTMLRVIDEVNPDIIFHLAAQSHVQISFKHPHLTSKTNIDGTLNILEAARVKDSDAIIHFAGSSEEYGLQIISEKHYQDMLKKYGVIYPEPKRIPELPINEDNPLRPQSPYAVTKVTGDYLMQLYHRAYGMKTIITRAFNHEGAGRGDNFVTSVITKQVIELNLGLKDYIEIGNVNVFRDWSHVEDIIEAYILSTKSKIYGRPINIGSGRTNSVLTYILWSLEEAGYDIRRLRTISGRLTIDNPSEHIDIRKFGLEWKGSLIDRILLDGEIEFTIEDKGLIIETNRGDVKVLFNKEKFRPAEVPILLCDYSFAKEKLRWKPRRALTDIIKEQLDYYRAKFSK